MNTKNLTFLVRRIALTLILFAAANARAGNLPDGFKEFRIATGLDPTNICLAQDGRVFVTQKFGIISLIKEGILLPTPFLDIQYKVDNFNERGIQSMVLDPQFETNGFIYVYYAVKDSNHNRVSRFATTGDVAIPGSEKIIIDLEGLSGTIHNGGSMFFLKGKLYITTGDGGGGYKAQLLTSLLGKVLKINPDGSVPEDNPFYNNATGIYRAIYAMGLRNPFRTAVQPGTNKIFINDVGQATYEEINELVAGANYGWPNIEGPITTETAPANYKEPIYYYTHYLGCSIGGAVFYNPSLEQFPEAYTGKYFFSDYCDGYIKTFDPETRVVAPFATNVNRPIAFAVDSKGNFYYIARGGLGGGSEESNTQSGTGEVWVVTYTGVGIPTISAQPSDASTFEGGHVTFIVGASGDAPLSYQWQKNGTDIPGANSYIYALSEATIDDAGARIRAIVRNNFGADTSREAILTVSLNLPPVATITSPDINYKYQAGTVLTYSGIASDPEDGPLPADAFTWVIDFHHNLHTHPGLAPTSGITHGSFEISNNNETSANVWYRIYLSVKDSRGQVTTVHQDVFPVTSDITLISNPQGIDLYLDGKEYSTPFTFKGVAGMKRNIEAPANVKLNGTTYLFKEWSTGTARQQDIFTPAVNSAIIALYLPNKLPVADAGADLTIALPTSPIILQGKGVDTDGSITTYSWTKISGPNAVLANTDLPNLTVNNLSVGNYIFRLTVTDNYGDTAFDEVQVTVYLSGNIAPVVYAGPDQIVTLPASSVTFTGTASDQDGFITNYVWSRISGPPATLVNAWEKTLTMTNFSTGTFVLRLLVYDNTGATAESFVKLIVKSPSSAAISEIRLADADAEKILQTLGNGSIINLAAKPYNMTFVAYTSPSVIGSVKWLWDDSEFKTVQNYPYSFTDNCWPGFICFNAWWRPSPGIHKLTAIPYTGTMGSGTAGIPYTITLQVINVASRERENTEINSAISSFAVSVHPNPFKNNFQVEMGEMEKEATITLTDALGKIVFTEKFLEVQETLVDLSPYQVSAGIYFINIVTGTSKAKVIKITKE